MRLERGAVICVCIWWTWLCRSRLLCGPFDAQVWRRRSKVDTRQEATCSVPHSARIPQHPTTSLSPITTLVFSHHSRHTGGICWVQYRTMCRPAACYPDKCIRCAVRYSQDVSGLLDRVSLTGVPSQLCRWKPART